MYSKKQQSAKLISNWIDDKEKLAAIYKAFLQTDHQNFEFPNQDDIKAINVWWLDQNDKNGDPKSYGCVFFRKANNDDQIKGQKKKSFIALLKLKKHDCGLQITGEDGRIYCSMKQNPLSGLFEKIEQQSQQSESIQ